ncbi:hypothetical protein [Methylococcus sp. EFPC2]|uniref:hypothetical protein n=1 Tax=Methylococcus sp. EFPC2 TaxID=2812648 RepID=UPI0019677119|nr:hypothetical protein [Methylococcus sp. EFPC2]QSA97946.1 hypothetical protein JWZ97_03710 [Methylococcus sp. EFPC2]
MQEKVLEALKIPTIELRGEYSFREIDQIYAQVGLAFVAFHEAFGIPIVQMQNHGASIASPHPGWVKRHILRENGHVYDETRDREAFSNNFIFYASEEELTEKIARLRASFNPWESRQTLVDKQAGFVNGSLADLHRALKNYA